MSWLDRIENTTFTITTGDGKVFTPLWKSGETNKEYNAAFYEFIDLPGSLIDRRKVKARSFPLVFWFTGADNIDQADDFDQSANDSRAWSVRHPFYGEITGQPVKINRNDNFYNCTEITLEFWETITDKVPYSNVNITDVNEGHVTQMATITPLNYSSKVNLKPADANTVTNNITLLNTRIAAMVSDVDYSDYIAAKSEMFATVDNLLTVPETAIGSIYTMITLPAKFALSVNIRMKLLGAIYGDMKALPGVAVSSLSDLVNSLSVRNNKAYFESTGAGVLMACANALVNPLYGDYVTRTDVLNASALLSSLYADYLQVLDNAYISITDTNNSFSASNETQALLQQTIIGTIANLGILALNAKQERSVILMKDSNLIVLTHKYMGLDAADANIETFRQINNIKNNRLFNVRKGSKITYYA